MPGARISASFQVLIPREVREELDLRPGGMVEILAYGGCIVLIPVRPVKEMRGFLRGLDTRVPREEDRPAPRAAFPSRPARRRR
jgi:AbrB family looped-hinge helix DNA binding protein